MHIHHDSFIPLVSSLTGTGELSCSLREDGIAKFKLWSLTKKKCNYLFKNNLAHVISYFIILQVALLALLNFRRILNWVRADLASPLLCFRSRATFPAQSRHHHSQRVSCYKRCFLQKHLFTIRKKKTIFLIHVFQKNSQKKLQ